MKVSNLLVTGGLEWDKNLIHGLFEAPMALAIVSVPLSTRPAKDAQFWRHTKDGIFTVRSAYWLGFLGKGGQGGTAMGADPGEVWSRIWSLDTMPKF